MLIEQLAHTNRWRAVSPAAKGLFALCGMVAVFAAATLPAAFAVTGVLVAVAVVGAGIKIGQYLRVAAPALLFLAASCLSLVFSVGAGDGGAQFALAASPVDLHHVWMVSARSLGGLAALLFLVLSTPIVDIIGLMRRLRTPGVLLDIMVLCYRTVFVFSECVHDMHTAQAARLGYATPRLAMRSLGELAANLVLQVWQRSQALHLAAQARNNDGPLRFLDTVPAHARRDAAIAAAAGTALIALALRMA